MSMNLWIAYIGTVLLMMSTPGPSQLLMLSNSIGNRFRRSLFTAAGDLSANLVQMIVASVGLASVLASSTTFFVAIKWAGVGYLVYLGLKLLLARKPPESALEPPKRSARALYWQGFLTSAANPKAVVFFAALFPQFIDPSRPLVTQFVILSATYLTIDGFFLSLYGGTAGWLSKKLVPSARQTLNRVSGGFLIGAAVLLGFKDVEPR